MNKIHVGEKIKSIRKKIGLSQKDFADKLGIQAPYLSEIENNKKELTLKVALAIKENFDISLDTLINEMPGPFFNQMLDKEIDREKDKNATICDSDLKLLVSNFGHIPIDDILEYIKYSRVKLRNLEKEYRQYTFISEKMVYSVHKIAENFDYDRFHGYRFNSKRVRDENKVELNSLDNKKTNIITFKESKIHLIIRIISYEKIMDIFTSQLQVDLQSLLDESEGFST